MSRRRSFDGTSAALSLIVGSVVRAGLDFDAKLVLVELGWQGPVEWRQSIRPGGWGDDWTVLSGVSPSTASVSVTNNSKNY